MKFEIIAPSWPKLPGQNEFDLPLLGPLQAAACVPEGVEVSITNENVQTVDLDGDRDLVGISLPLTCMAPRGYELARGFRRRGKTVVLGGLHVTLCPEEAAGQADAIVVGEGEGLIEQMISDFSEGKLKKVYQSKNMPDIKALPQPRRELYDKAAHYSYKGWELVDLVETSRGCRFDCYPCCVPYTGRGRHRIRPWEHVAEDLESCHKLIFIVDSSLEQSIDYQRELFTRLASTGKRWISHPISADPELLNLARAGGCWYVYHAIYDISEKIRDRIKMYHDHGIAVEGTILMGLDDHDEDFLLRLIDFLLSIDLDLAEFTVLTPFPRTKVFEDFHKQGRIIDRDWSHYNASTVVYKPRSISPDRLQEIYYQAWEAFYGQRSQNLRMTGLFLDVIRDLEPAGRRRPGRDS